MSYCVHSKHGVGRIVCDDGGRRQRGFAGAQKINAIGCVWREINNEAGHTVARNVNNSSARSTEAI